jgi:hypothetical protein
VSGLIVFPTRVGVDRFCGVYRPRDNEYQDDLVENRVALCYVFRHEGMFACSVALRWRSSVRCALSERPVEFQERVRNYSFRLALLHLLWMLVSGQLLPSRGALFPGLKAMGLPTAAIRRAWAAFRYGAWRCATLLTLGQQGTRGHCRQKRPKTA